MVHPRYPLLSCRSYGFAMLVLFSIHHRVPVNMGVRDPCHGKGRQATTQLNCSFDTNFHFFRSSCTHPSHPFAISVWSSQCNMVLWLSPQVSPRREVPFIDGAGYIDVRGSLCTEMNFYVPTNHTQAN